MVTSAFGGCLRHRETSRECGGRLTVVRWDFAPGLGLHALAVEVGRHYVSDAARLATPGARVGPKVPTADTVVAGDFGEMLTRAIYTARMGMQVPFNKLQSMKPVREATVQGPDVLCLTLAPGEVPEPVTVEAKTRTKGWPSDVLGAIGTSASVTDEDYLVSAWAAGAEMMLGHPDHRRHFALSAAQHLGRLTDPDAALPPHAVHAVAIVGQDRLTRNYLALNAMRKRCFRRSEHSANGAPCDSLSGFDSLPDRLTERHASRNQCERHAQAGL